MKFLAASGQQQVSQQTGLKLSQESKAPRTATQTTQLAHLFIMISFECASALKTNYA